MWVKEQQLESDTEQFTGSKLGKEYDKAIYCHLAHLTYMQSVCMCHIQSVSCSECVSHVQLLASLWTVAHQDPQSMGFSRHEYGSGLPFPSPGGSSRPRDRT